MELSFDGDPEYQLSRRCLPWGGLHFPRVLASNPPQASNPPRATNLREVLARSNLPRSNNKSADSILLALLPIPLRFHFRARHDDRIIEPVPG